MMTVRYTCHVLMLIALAVAAAVPVTVSAQSLGELAKQEEARRKAIKTPGKVYTNDSIRSTPAPARPASQAADPSVPASVPAPTADNAVETASADGAAPASGETAKQDEAYWKKRMLTARDALDRSQTFAEALQSRINALTTDFAARDDPAQRAAVAADRQKALAELDRVKQEIQEYTRAITAVREEARRAGVPPGWLR